MHIYYKILNGFEYNAYLFIRKGLTIQDYIERHYIGGVYILRIKLNINNNTYTIFNYAQNLYNFCIYNAFVQFIYKTI